MAEHKVEALILEGQALRIGRERVHLQAQALRVICERTEHAGGDVCAGRLFDDARAHQVEREIAGARADLQRAVIAARLGAERLLHLRAHLLRPMLAEIDPPLGVVVPGCDVVVAGVDVADLLGAESLRHGPAPYSGPVSAARSSDLGAAQAPLYAQRDQPDGVPPLALTGERTLPDVPEENYWYRRHLIVYEWIAAKSRGHARNRHGLRRGLWRTHACGQRASVVGVDANPEAHEHAQLRYEGGNLRFARDLIETFSAPADAVVFLQTIEHLQDAGAALAHFKELVGPAGVVFLSTPNVRTLAPKGAERSDNPWHVHEYTAAEFERLCLDHFAGVEMFGLFHARKLRAHELALKLGWDSVHPRMRLTKRFYGWFTPAISARDFALKPKGSADLDRALDFVAVCRA